MNTSKKITIDIPDYQIDYIREYVDIIKELHETSQLFNMFYYNRSKLLFAPEKTNESFPVIALDLKSNYTEINNLVNNFITSAYSLIEFLTRRGTNMMDEDNEKEFDDYIQLIHENSIIYRTMINLRHFIQHRGFIIDYKNDEYILDLCNMICTKNYDFRPEFKKDLKILVQKYYSQEDPRELLVRDLVKEYTGIVFEIYQKYIDCISKNVKDSYDRTNNIIKANPMLKKSLDTEDDLLQIFDKNIFGNQIEVLLDLKLDGHEIIKQYEKIIYKIIEEEVNISYL